MLRSITLIFAVILVAGCSSSRETVVTPPPSTTLAPTKEPIVSPPLAGVDSNVVALVASTFDSTFVVAQEEQAGDARFLEGRQVQQRLDSLLQQQHGAGPLGGSAGTDSDTTAVEEAQRMVVAAVQAQARQDSTEALLLLGEAQQLFEAALQHNPYHEDARYQLARLYTIQAQQYRDRRQWETVLQMVRGLLKLNADQHALWAELAVVLDTLQQHESSGLAWMQAASVVLEDAELAFVDEAPAPDSLTLFRYYQRAYSVFVEDRNGAGVREALERAIHYAADTEQQTYARGELDWATWDGERFEHRLAFDSLLTRAGDYPEDARDGLSTLLLQLEQSSAYMEANYNVAILTWHLEEYDRALDTLQGLWSQAGMTDQMPYAEFLEDLKETYASLLFQRGLQYRLDGASANAFTYLIMVAELGSRYSGQAYIEALKLTRSNPQQALQLEPRIESIFDSLTAEEQRTFLSLMGNLYRRVGDAVRARAFLDRFRMIEL